MFETNCIEIFLGTTEFGEAQKIGGSCLWMPPCGYRPALGVLLMKNNRWV